MLWSRYEKYGPKPKTSKFSEKKKKLTLNLKTNPMLCNCKNENLMAQGHGHRVPHPPDASLVNSLGPQRPLIGKYYKECAKLEPTKTMASRS